MKKSFLILLLMGFAAAAHGAPMVRWLETEHDFGTFAEELETVSCQMRFVNDGDSAVVITSVRPTCGCTASDYPRRAIEPGDTATILLKYNPIGRPGRFRKGVYVYTSASSGKSVIYIKGNVVGSPSTMQSKYPIAVGALKVDAKTVPFGELTKGQSRTSFINGYNLGKDTLRVTFESVPKHLRVAAVPEIVPPGEMAVVTVTYYTDKKDDWGLTQDDFGVVVAPVGAVAADSAGGKLKVDVMAILNENFDKYSPAELAEAPVATCLTDKLDFGTLGSEKAKQTFTVGNTGKSPLQIRKIYTLDPYLGVACDDKQVKAGKTATVQVTVDPSLVDASYVNGKLTVITNDPKRPRIYIRVVGLKDNSN